MNSSFECEKKIHFLVVDRFNRVLVEKTHGYAFEPRSTDLQNAVLFDEAGADHAIERLVNTKQLVDGGPYKKRTVRDFKSQILESFLEI